MLFRSFALIALKFGVTVNQLYAANPNLDWDDLCDYAHSGTTGTNTGITMTRTTTGTTSGTTTTGTIATTASSSPH
ncbi:hypothetical protein D9758_006401 [Tetrapyrgos nigripes]|uniref:LysM domain-containing protein n=1 Tax=Tetrapyrgos nigripes TaxID=182062 RepID=A0A8H5D8F9_9AGAR|nr:hypothetical protein D9758_006401 [Tetrapyrgos nigripes]